MWTAVFHALGTNVRLRVEPPEVVDTLRGLISAFAPARGPRVDIDYRFTDGPQVLRDGREFRAPVEVIDLPPIFERDLYERLLARCAEPWLLHAAALVVGGRALLLAGASGTGKSTLARALLLRGHRYVTDEFACVAADGAVRGITRPIHLADAPGDEVPAGDFETTEYAVRLENGATSRSRLLTPPLRLLCHEPVPLAGCVCLASDPPGDLALRRLPAGAALRELWPCSWRRDPPSLATAVAVANRWPVWRLERGGIEETCAALERLAD